MVQLNKNLGNFNLKNTALSAKTNATQTKKLDFKPAINDRDFKDIGDAKNGRVMPGDTIGGKLVVSVIWWDDNGTIRVEVGFEDGGIASC